MAAVKREGMGWLRKMTTSFRRMWIAMHSVVLLRLRPDKRGEYSFLALWSSSPSSDSVLPTWQICSIVEIEHSVRKLYKYNIHSSLRRVLVTYSLLQVFSALIKAV